MGESALLAAMLALALAAVKLGEKVLSLGVKRIQNGSWKGTTVSFTPQDRERLMEMAFVQKEMRDEGKEATGILRQMFDLMRTRQ